MWTEGIYIFDCEVFAHDWLFVFKDTITEEYTVIHNDNDAVEAFMERDPCLGGFNNKHYDNHILKAVLCGFTPEEVKKINDDIIVREMDRVAFMQQYTPMYEREKQRAMTPAGITAAIDKAAAAIPDNGRHLLENREAARREREDGYRRLTGNDWLRKLSAKADAQALPDEETEGEA